MARNADALQTGLGEAPGEGPPGDDGASTTDEALLRAGREGDQRAFRRFADRHGPRIYNTAWRLTNDRHLAEDIAQEVLVRALRRDPGGQASLVAWLYVVTRNLALNACRSRRRRRVAGAVLEAHISAARSDPSASLARRELSDAVQAAIADLPEPQRAALVLAKYEGLSADQIAEILGCTRDAVKMRVSRAMARLRRVLTGHQQDGDETS